MEVDWRKRLCARVYFMCKGSSLCLSCSFFFWAGRAKTGSNHRLSKHGPVSWVTLICHETFHTPHGLCTYTHVCTHWVLHTQRHYYTHNLPSKNQTQLLRLTNPSPAQTRPDIPEPNSGFPHKPIWKDPELVPYLLFSDKHTHTSCSKSHAKLHHTGLFF